METSKTGPRSFPLSALFMLVTVSGVIAALEMPVVRSLAAGNIGVAETAAASVFGAFFVMMLGGLVGLYHYRRLRGLLWGLLVGCCIGVIVGPVALSPPDDFPALLVVCSGGSVALLVLSLSFRTASRPL